MTTLTTLYIIVMNLMLALTVLKLLKFAKDSEYKPQLGAAIFGVWLVVETMILTLYDWLPQSSLGLFALVLVGVTLAGVIMSPLFKTLLALPQEFLLLPQAFRMFFGAGFIIEAVYSIMPATYGVVDGVLHITTAFLSVTLAIYIAHGFKANRSLLLVNLFGLLDIVMVAGGIAFFIYEDIGSTHNVFYAVFYAAPIFIWLHVLSLYKLYKERRVDNA